MSKSGTYIDVYLDLCNVRKVARVIEAKKVHWWLTYIHRPGLRIRENIQYNETTHHMLKFRLGTLPKFRIRYLMTRISKADSENSFASPVECVNA
jgi:hypothetical protein